MSRLYVGYAFAGVGRVVANKCCGTRVSALTPEMHIGQHH